MRRVAALTFLLLASPATADMPLREMRAQSGLMGLEVVGTGDAFGMAWDAPEGVVGSVELVALAADGSVTVLDRAPLNQTGIVTLRAPDTPGAYSVRMVIDAGANPGAVLTDRPLQVVAP